MNTVTKFDFHIDLALKQKQRTSLTANQVLGLRGTFLPIQKDFMRILNTQDIDRLAKSRFERAIV